MPGLVRLVQRPDPVDSVPCHQSAYCSFWAGTWPILHSQTICLYRSVQLRLDNLKTQERQEQLQEIDEWSQTQMTRASFPSFDAIPYAHRLFNIQSTRRDAMVLCRPCVRANRSSRPLKRNVSSLLRSLYSAQPCQCLNQQATSLTSPPLYIKHINGLGCKAMQSSRTMAVPTWKNPMRVTYAM